MGTIVARGRSFRAVIRRRGQTKTKTFRKRSLAQRWIMLTEGAIEARKVISGGQTVGSILAGYREHVVDQKPYPTKSGAHYDRLAKQLEDDELEEMTPAWWADTAREWDCSPQSRTRYVGLMLSALKWGEVKYDLTLDWDSYKRGRKLMLTERLIAKSKPRQRRLKSGELDLIKKHVSSEMPIADILDFALELGFRMSEITRIKWADIDRDKRMILVRDRKHPKEKIGNDWWVPLLGKSLEIIERQTTKDHESGFIFPYKAESIECAIRRACKAAGIKGLRPHDLRHEALSRLFEPLYDPATGMMIRAGYSIQEVCLVSGHLDWSSLKIYTNLDPASLHAGPAGAGRVIAMA